MFDHDPDSNELMDQIDEFLYEISKIKLTKEQKQEIRKLIKD
jgi:Na+/phosphate symporter